MHAITTRRFPSETTKEQILRACNEEAIEEGDYHTALDGIRFNDTVLENEEAAAKWIEAHDRGFYDNLAIRYKEGRRIYWLVKYEYHC